jgi:hypothetical protein
MFGKLTKHIIKYLVFFTINIVIINFAIYLFLNTHKTSDKVKPNSIGLLNEKLEYYKLTKDSFDFLFVGDSRTYTNVHNLMFDTILKTRSYNHSVWANWFPTQYAFFVDLLPIIPDSTTLVFSMGYQNFLYGEIQETYPINKELLPLYYNWGFSFKDLRNPVSLTNSYLHPIIYLEQKRHRKNFNKLMQKYMAVLFTDHPKKHELKINKKHSQNVSIKSDEISKKAKELNSYYNLLPGVNYSSINYQSDTITSLVVYWQKGNYWRVELLPEFFRNKQHENYLQIEKEIKKNVGFTPDDRYWNNFKAIVELLGKHSKRLKIIVNEMEEAPYCYTFSGRTVYDEFAKNKVIPLLKENGLSYIKVDVSSFPNSYYFDYNHLNSEGSIVYTQKLAEKLSNNKK